MKVIEEYPLSTHRLRTLKIPNVIESAMAGVDGLM